MLLPRKGLKPQLQLLNSACTPELGLVTALHHHYTSEETTVSNDNMWYTF